LEKIHRLGEDVRATKLCCSAILEVLFEAKDWKSLNEHILLLAKRRSQLKQVHSVSVCVLAESLIFCCAVSLRQLYFLRYIYQGFDHVIRFLSLVL
jgi:hypothetical protein